MKHLERFSKETELISKYGNDKAHLISAIGLYLDSPDLMQLASEGLTDGGDDKKIDFIKLEDRRLIIAQGTYSKDKAFYKAKSNKAADLNTAIAWIFSGDIEKLREDTNNFEVSIKSVVSDIRNALQNDEIEEIDVLYIHNYGESQNVRDELETVKTHLENYINKEVCTVKAIELGAENIEKIYITKQAAIAIEDTIELENLIRFEEKGNKWRAGVLSIAANWLQSLYAKYGDSLFSANYRGFLGISNRGRKRINLGIQTTAQNEPVNFWAFNNGITILTNKFYEKNNKTYLEGISIINGAQTTGSIGHSNIPETGTPMILARIIESSDSATIDNIVEYNNTQNEITSWDRFSKAPEQERIRKEFSTLGYNYSIKRGFENINQDLSIEVVAQPSTALHGNYLEAGSGKNTIFDNQTLYEDSFKNSKAKHLLLAYCLVKSVDFKRSILKQKFNEQKCTDEELNQLTLLSSLRFKYFILSVIGNQFETILGESVDIKNVAFKKGVVGAEYNSIQQLVELCQPLSNTIITIASKKIKNSFTEVMYNKEYIQGVFEHVGNAISMLKEVDDNLFTKFASYIAPKG